MKNIDNRLTFTVPLTQEAHQLAEKHRCQQHDPQKGKQVYLNTLAVYAVRVKAPERRASKAATTAAATSQKRPRRRIILRYD